MDLYSIEEIARPRGRQDLPSSCTGDAWLAGGTWLFSEPQPGLRRLIDLTGLGWPALTVDDTGLFVAATCTIETLRSFEPPAMWAAASLFDHCCAAFLASFKIAHVATVGGNICLALPAAPMISLAAALDATCVIWTADGVERRLSILDFVLGSQKTALLPGELLRGIHLPVGSLTRRSAFRRTSLTPGGRSAALLIGTLSGDGAFRLTVSASTKRPTLIVFPHLPTAGALRDNIDAMLAPELYHDDVHGRPDWRRHMTLILAEEIRAEFLDGCPPSAEKPSARERPA